MKSFNYVVKDALGIHARPAGLLAKEAKNFQSKILLKKDDKEVDVSRLMDIMALVVKCGNQLTVTADGPDEDAAIEAFKKFFEEQL